MQQPPPRRRRRASSGAFARTLVVLAVLGFAGWYIYDVIGPGEIGTATIQAGTLGARYQGDALIVRNETVFDQDGATSIEYVAEEGGAVARGDIICYVYSAGFSQKELTTLQTYRTQIKEYHKTLLASSSTVDVKMTRLETDVLERAMEVRALVQGTRGNLLNQEKLLAEAISSRQVYLRQKFPDDQRLSRLYDDESSQLQRIESWTKQYSATAASLVSFYTDGYENVLNTSNYAAYSPTEVRAMYNGTLPASESSLRERTPIYRMIRQNAWNVLMLCDETEMAWTPVTGRTYKLLIESFDSTVVDATVESFTRSGGELLVRLSVASDVTPVLYIRNCHVQVGEYVDSMMVPTNAIYTRDGQKGVVIVYDGGNYFVPVNVVSSNETVTHITPVESGYLYVGQTILTF